MYRIDKIERVRLNNRNVKLVTVYKLIGNSWLYYGQYDIPATVSNKRALEYLQL